MSSFPHTPTNWFTEFDQDIIDAFFTHQKPQKAQNAMKLFEYVVVETLPEGGRAVVKDTTTIMAKDEKEAHDKALLASGRELNINETNVSNFTFYVRDWTSKTAAKRI